MNLSNHDPLFGPLLNVVSPQHSEYYKLKMNTASFTTASLSVMVSKNQT